MGRKKTIISAVIRNIQQLYTDIVGFAVFPELSVENTVFWVTTSHG
jgi:hypothetical protein